MKGTLQDLINSLKPLGEHKTHGKQIKFNCRQCELDGNPIDKYNLEVNFFRNQYHCWCCNDSGSLYRLIKKYGFPEYLPLFKTTTDVDLLSNAVKIKQFDLPPHLISASQHKEAFDYLKTRRVTGSQIKKFQIKYCFTGLYKNHLVFPSYTKNGKIVCYVTHSLSTKQYKTHKSQDFVCFWENHIDRNSKIILTEGIYDALSLPNAIPLLGLTISNKLLEWLADCDVMIAQDSVVNTKVKKENSKKLMTVTDKISYCKIPIEFEDPNKMAVKANDKLISLLSTFY